MKSSGHTDLPLHNGRVPAWLYERMGRLGRSVVEMILIEHGRDEFLRRISDPFWFQSFGAVLGMDWHSSGITTSVLGALKSSLNPIAHQTGLYFCGGRGKASRRTPHELRILCSRIGLDGQALIRSSRLSAKIDNTAIQDGYQIYLHSFIVTEDGHWGVVQQGLNATNGMARRYHWHSDQIESFVSDPHTNILGFPQGDIVNMVASGANPAQNTILEFCQDKPELILREATRLIMPQHHDIRAKDIHIRRLGAMLHLAHEKGTQDFEQLLLLQGMGPRTLQSMALVSEIIFGKAVRFSDPARFAFAHGGKDGHPFPVPLKVYDESISFLSKTVEAAKLQRSDRREALQALHKISKRLEADFVEQPDRYSEYIDWERKNSRKWGGRTVADDPPRSARPSQQLKLF